MTNKPQPEVQVRFLTCYIFFPRRALSLKKFFVGYPLGRYRWVDIRTKFPLQSKFLFQDWKQNGGANPLGRVCHTCRLVRPIRSKHCKICNRCIKQVWLFWPKTTCQWVGLDEKCQIQKRSKRTTDFDVIYICRNG